MAPFTIVCSHSKPHPAHFQRDDVITPQPQLMLLPAFETRPSGNSRRRALPGRPSECGISTATRYRLMSRQGSSVARRHCPQKHPPMTASRRKLAPTSLKRGCRTVKFNTQALKHCDQKRQDRRLGYWKAKGSPTIESKSASSL